MSMFTSFFHYSNDKSQSSAAMSTRIEHLKHQQESRNCGGNQNRKTTKMLTKKNWVMLWWNERETSHVLEFCIRATVSTTQLSKPIESLLKKNTWRSLQRNLVEHMFSVYIELVSTVVEDVKKDRKVHLTLRSRLDEHYKPVTSTAGLKFKGMHSSVYWFGK